MLCNIQVGGSDFAKQQERLGTPHLPVDVRDLFDFCFSENGLVAYRFGEPLKSTSFIDWIGEEKYQDLVNFSLGYPFQNQAPKEKRDIH
jgi:phosphomannomutase